MSKKQRIALLAALLLASLILPGCRGRNKHVSHTPNWTTPSPTESTGPECEHDYLFDHFYWTKDHRASAVYICSKDASHIDRREAEVQSETIVEPTPEKAGEKKSTARFDGHEETVTGPCIAEEVSLTVYAVNDFHGAVKKADGSAGLAYFASYFKEKGEDPNTLLIDSGDTWQGSLLSNYNYGALISNVYNYVRFDAKTLGNHEFDWGTEIIRDNAALTSYGYNTPYLAANVYDYDFASKKAGTVQQSDLGGKSVIYDLPSGIRVGIVGVIGTPQLTSISSMYTTDICFLDHVRVIKEEAASLRAQGCDVVICSIHAEQGVVLRQNLAKYVDLVLCAHSHQVESANEGDLLFAQFGANGVNYGRIDMTYHASTGGVTSKMTVLSAEDVISGTEKIDDEIAALIDRYSAACSEIANEVVAGNVLGTFSGSVQLPNLMCRAMYETCAEQGYDVCLAYVNKGRASLSSWKWTYADLCDVFPFDDMVYIVDVTGRELLDEVFKYNYVYVAEDFRGAQIDPKATYRIACVDYVYFHTNGDRSYDYFPQSAGRYEAVLEDNYRLILRDWLIANGYASGKRLNADDFLTTQPGYHR